MKTDTYLSFFIYIITEVEDRIPKNLAKVLENPRKYIPGPDSIKVSLNNFHSKNMSLTNGSFV